MCLVALPSSWAGASGFVCTLVATVNISLHWCHSVLLQHKKYAELLMLQLGMWYPLNLVGQVVDHQ